MKIKAFVIFLIFSAGTILVSGGFAIGNIWARLDPKFGEDITGRTPRQVVKEFMVHCKNGDHEKALSLWTPETKSRLERNEYIGSFTALCQMYAESDYEIEDATTGKYPTIIFVPYRHKNKDGHAVLYIEIRDSEWKLKWN